MKQLVFACVLLALAGTAASAGVVIEMQVQGTSTSGEVGRDRIYTQGEMLRIDSHATELTGNISMIFRDEEMRVLDHDKKTCQTIDKEGLDEIGGAMKQMQAELAKLPPEQRAMMERMMKGKMPGMGTEQAARRIDVGATEKVGDYSCKLKTMYAGEQKVWEVCAAETPPDALTEAMGAFRALSRFTESLKDIVQQGPLAGMIDNPLHDLNEVGGFPVRTRAFGNGQLIRETTLESVERQDLGDDVFSIPEGYKVQSLMDQMKRGR